MIPKLEAVYNLLDDLLKVCGSSAEMFFLSAYQGLAFKVPKGEDLEQTEYGQMAKKLAKQLGLEWAESMDLKRASVKIY